MMRRLLSPQFIPLLATIAVFILLYVAAGLRYDNFISWNVLLIFLRDYSFLGLAALGMTFVILSGGIDLSVGAMIGLVSIAVARLLEEGGLHPGIVIPLVLIGGTIFGAGQGALIALFGMPPFLVTLAGMFLARGLGFVISLQSISIVHPVYEAMVDFSFDVFPITAIVFLVAVAIAMYLAHMTPFGRNVYALGGNEQSAVLMGLPVRRTKVAIYALSGLCAAMGGVLYTLYLGAGNATAGTMLELDAIAAVVIGGTLLSGGVGYVIGTAVGVMILALIQTAIIFEGTLSSWWTKIAIGALLLVFILLQKIVQGTKRGGGG